MLDLFGEQLQVLPEKLKAPTLVCELEAGALHLPRLLSPPFGVFIDRNLLNRGGLLPREFREIDIGVAALYAYVIEHVREGHSAKLFQDSVRGNVELLCSLSREFLNQL